ncbi:SlyX family protein [uncultured Marinobacter sp.]|uniref:SlyX family protein n=1 Tax=uncultured Marinobacter sp. TaxID=187379 RepID=UPI0030D7A61D|tara:strand:- start:57 stop:305 length:249 start_codon:yes stop_codon:yes gene_type:complete
MTQSTEAQLAEQLERLTRRLDELETRLAFQDDTITTLSDQLAEQEMDIRKLWEAKQNMHKQLKEMAPSNLKAEHEETPPPHY